MESQEKFNASQKMLTEFEQLEGITLSAGWEGSLMQKMQNIRQHKSSKMPTVIYSVLALTMIAINTLIIIKPESRRISQRQEQLIVLQNALLINQTSTDN